MDLKGKKVLVTGADGFIGSHLVHALVEAGADVKAMVLYNTLNRRGWLEDLPADIQAACDVSFGDIRDQHYVMHAMEGCDIVFHLAALIAIPYSYQAPESYIATNMQGTHNLLQAAKAHGVTRFIHTSTSEVYGTAQQVPIPETHRLHAQSPYAASKIGADQMVQAFYCSYDLPVVTIRPFNTYGPRQSARAVIPSIIIQLAHQKKSVLKLGALTPTRDFSYVEDTVSGFIAAAKAPLGTIKGETINLGSQFEISIEETVALIVEAMQSTVTIETEDARLRPEKSEVQRLFADTQKAQTLLPWSPQYTQREGFERGLEKTIAWFSQPENLAFYHRTHYHQ